MAVNDDRFGDLRRGGERSEGVATHRWHRCEDQERLVRAGTYPWLTDGRRVDLHARLLGQLVSGGRGAKARRTR
jgi:hypothetical protein